MVQPGHHYGPDVDGYEYSPVGHLPLRRPRRRRRRPHPRDRHRVHRRSTPQPWSEVYESLEPCPDELLLFFHHVPYGHVLHSGSTVIQHIYDTHFEGVRGGRGGPAGCGRGLADLVDPARARAGGGAARRAAALRPGVARPDQHLLLPQVRGAGRAGPRRSTEAAEDGARPSGSRVTSAVARARTVLPVSRSVGARRGRCSAGRLGAEWLSRKSSRVPSGATRVAVSRPRVVGVRADRGRGGPGRGGRPSRRPAGRGPVATYQPWPAPKALRVTAGVPA